MIAVALGGHVLNHTDLQVLKKLLKNIPKKSLVTHGNGPHVGELYVKTRLPLHVCVAQTQWTLGFPIAKAVSGEVMMTRVLVERKDAAFRKPTKPIGDYYRSKPKEKWSFIKTPKGFRRVVPSPEPMEIIEKDSIAKVLRKKTVVACGGGGIPVCRESGRLVGVDCVIDKDLASQVLANSIGIKILVIITEEKGACVNYGKPDQMLLGKVTLKELEKYYSQRHFPEGSMGPKVLACIRFLKNGGKMAVISGSEEIGNACKGQTGTIVTLK